MKRQVIAVLLGSALALPAFATDGEIDNGFTPNVRPESTKSRDQVRAELLAAQATRGSVDGEIGNIAPVAASSAKSSAEVRAELTEWKANGAFGVDGETGQPVPHA